MVAATATLANMTVIKPNAQQRRKATSSNSHDSKPGLAPRMEVVLYLLADQLLLRAARRNPYCGITIDPLPRPHFEPLSHRCPELLLRIRSLPRTPSALRRSRGVVHQEFTNDLSYIARQTRHTQPCHAARCRLSV